MNQANDDIRAALEAVLAGRLDELTPEAVDRLEAYLNADPAAAAPLAERVPVPRFRVPARAPSTGTWERMWGCIEKAAKPAAARPRIAGILRLWAPLGAAAACLLLAGLWQVGRSAQPAWPITWAHEVEISELQVFPGGTPLVLAAGTDEPISVLWVLESEGQGV